MKNIKTYETFNQDVLNHELLYYSNKTASLNKIRELLNNGADPNCRDGLSRTPLYYACDSMFYSCVKLLIEHGADVNLATRDNQTPFYNLSHMGKYVYIKSTDKIHKIIDILIENGADLSISPIGDDWIKNASDGLIEHVKEKYPKKYKEYLIKKDAGTYNL